MSAQTVGQVLIGCPQLCQRPELTEGSETCFYLLTINRLRQGSMGFAVIPWGSRNILFVLACSSDPSLTSSTSK